MVEKGYAERPPRERAQKVTEKAWKQNQDNVYNKIDAEGYGWIKTRGQCDTLRDIFNIQVHIPNGQIPEWIKEYRRKGDQQNGDSRDLYKIVLVR